jgi:hypothetical protein
LLWGIAIHLPSEDGAAVFDGISRMDEALQLRYASATNLLYDLLLELT